MSMWSHKIKTNSDVSRLERLVGPEIFKRLQERKVSYIILNQAAKIETELVGHRPHCRYATENLPYSHMCSNLLISQQ